MVIDQIKVIKRKVKYPRIELKTGKPKLIVPKNQKINYQKIISKHKIWLNRKIDFINKIKEKYKKEKIYCHNEKKLVILIENYVKKSLKF